MPLDVGDLVRSKIVDILEVNLWDDLNDSYSTNSSIYLFTEQEKMRLTSGPVIDACSVNSASCLRISFQAAVTFWPSGSMLFFKSTNRAGYGADI
jgi:hypothetical protein